MRFSLIDRIVDLKAGDSITATKCLSLSEEYLADHFPRFPVMPGVMMLEAMSQASGWLVRISEDFAHSVVVLREARNVKFADFVEPGQVLTVSAKIVKQDEQTTTFKAEGRVDDRSAVSARLILERYNLADRYPSRGPSDHFIRRKMRCRLGLILDRPATTETVSPSQ